MKEPSETLLAPVHQIVESHPELRPMLEQLIFLRAK